MRTSATNLKDQSLERGGSDSRIAVGVLVLLTLTPSLAKFGLFGMNGDAETGSLASEFFWGSAYAISIWRLIVHRERAGRLLKRTWPLVTFLGLAVASYFWSVAPAITLRNAMEMVGMSAACYYFVVRFTLGEFLEIAVKYFVGVSIVSAVLIFLWPSHGRSSYGVVGWAGLFSEKNGFGAAMSLSILTYGVAAATAEGARRWRMLSCVLMGIFLLAGSQSVTSLLIFVSTAATVVATVLCSSPRYGITARFAVISVALAGIIGITLIGPDTSPVLGFFGKSENLSGRADFWPGVIRAIGDRPILGFGYNAFFLAAETEKQYLAPLLGWWFPFHAHNSYYQATLSLGFVGVTIFACALVPAVLLSIMRVVRDHEVVAAWPLAMLVYVILGSFTETYFGLPNFITSVFFIIAMLYPFREAMEVKRRTGRPSFARPNAPSSAV